MVDADVRQSMRKLPNAVDLVDLGTAQAPCLSLSRNNRSRHRK